jgi:MFS family permease
VNETTAERAGEPGADGPRQAAKVEPTTTRAPSPTTVGIDSRTGWLVSGATFLATFTVFGVAYSFGSFFGPMADEFGSDRGATALFFAITTFAYFSLGMITGRIADVRGPRPVLIFGAVCLVVGLLATSLVQSIWIGYLTYGLGVGLGVGCAYVPMVAAVGGWFERQRTTALGVAVAGIGVGTLTVAPATEALVEAHGWRQTYVILAVGAAGLLSIAALGARRPPIATAAGAGSPLRAILTSNRTFWVLYLSLVMMTIPLFVPFVFLPDYVDTEQISGSAGWLIGLIGIASVAGRLGHGALAVRLPVTRLYRYSFMVMSLSFLLWLGAGQSYGTLLTFTVVLGVAYGGFIALSPAVAAEHFGANGLGAILGAWYTAAGIGGLVGPPIMGRVIDGSGYQTALTTALVVGVLASGLLWLIPSTHTPAAT